MSDQKAPLAGETTAAGAEPPAERPHSAGACKTVPPLPPEARDVIAEKLRGLYDSLVSEPLPERFTRLLDELAAKESQRAPSRKPEDQS